MSIGFSPLPELRRMSIGLLPLESGESIDDCSITWVEHGLADPDAPVALVPCAMGSTHQCMDFLIGPGLTLDTRWLHMLAVSALGNGLSTSPFNSAQQPVHTFPVFSIPTWRPARHGCRMNWGSAGSFWFPEPRWTACRRCDGG